MKLRNKKTGEIVDLSIFGITLNIRSVEQPTYHSIEGVCEDWEDYKPAEPLIKDKRIRNAVRAWADTNQSKFITSAGNYTATDNRGLMIEFNKSWTTYMENGKQYTITELCGEEEE